MRPMRPSESLTAVPSGKTPTILMKESAKPSGHAVPFILYMIASAWLGQRAALYTRLDESASYTSQIEMIRPKRPMAEP